MDIEGAQRPRVYIIYLPLGRAINNIDIEGTCARVFIFIYFPRALAPEGDKCYLPKGKGLRIICIRGMFSFIIVDILKFNNNNLC